MPRDKPDRCHALFSEEALQATRSGFRSREFGVEIRPEIFNGVTPDLASWNVQKSFSRKHREVSSRQSGQESYGFIAIIVRILNHGPINLSVPNRLQRLGVSKIDLVTIHDITEPMLGKDWRQQLEIAKKGAMPELTRMREEGIIGSWGMGVNNLETCLEAMEAANPDIMLQATRYNLLDHKEALAKLFPKARANDVALIIGAPLGAGYLAGTDRWLYGGDVPAGFADKRARMDKIANKHGTDLRTAALQFTTAPDIVAATIPGARNAEQARANHASMTQAIPAAFWQDMKQQGLIAEDAPTPG